MYGPRLLHGQRRVVSVVFVFSRCRRRVRVSVRKRHVFRFISLTASGIRIAWSKFWPPFDFFKYLYSVINTNGWLGSWVVSVLDSGAEWPGFKSQSRRCRVAVFWANCSHPLCHCSPSSKVGSSPLKGCGVTAALAESNGSLPPGLWLTSFAGWLPRTGISSGTLRSVIEYWLPLPLPILMTLNDVESQSPIASF